jgi:hypothetical protein
MTTVQLTDEWLRWLAGGGIAAIVYFLQAMVSQLSGINKNISDLLVREAKRDSDLTHVRRLISSRPCLHNGCKGEDEEDNK